MKRDMRINARRRTTGFNREIEKYKRKMNKNAVGGARNKEEVKKMIRSKWWLSKTKYRI